jgi:hypothetical protein
LPDGAAPVFFNIKRAAFFPRIRYSLQNELLLRAVPEACRPFP